MKEIMAIVRLNKVNATKEALASAGFPAFTCRKVLGRGKKSVDPSLIQSIIENGDLPVSPVGEYFTEGQRLIPKRYFNLMVPDECVQKVVETLIETNHTGNLGDGKIFVLPIEESYRIRNGELQTDTESY
ncbi:P-II family nitrogen regulator [Parasporobacterium paucivorans]|uniref:Nitrogen regulatory protein P-II family n=1 Tax=Parasporobacterium paucivorans DSM 15970 TaxID=1122934 RepID=A0A1M6IIQ6_9FIRM|nr:P-II family nitrogen regulator [Parasporobacterium paucivorans]SHJ34305.1 nitrogen regulatory protein P-II family [Parasporobacterium paucivorans DSM 15970]